MNSLRILVMLAIFYASEGYGKDYYVSPLGNDSFDGTSLQIAVDSLIAPKSLLDLSNIVTHGPFKTLERAKSAIRDLKNKGEFTEPVTVHVQSGTYQLLSPLSFDERDSGALGKEITWQAENGTVLITGGVPLKSCQATQAGRWTCSTTEYNLDAVTYPNTDRKKGNIPGFELFVNDQRMQLARWPNNDWAHIRLPLDESSHFTSLENLPANISGDSNAQVHIMPGNDWYDQYIGVATIKQDQNEISLSANTKYKLQSGRRYYLRNIASQLDAPSEWIYNADTKKITFIPPNNANPDTIIASIIDNLIQINRSNYISFIGFKLSHGTENTIEIKNGQNITFDNIEVTLSGHNAINAKEVINFKLVNSHIHNTGGGGIYILGGDRDQLTPSNNVISNNNIHNTGEVLLMYTPPIEIGGVGAAITHNLVYQAPSIGILFRGNDHLIEKNEIHDACEQSSDCGAIYTGRDWTYRGNIIRYNSIHDILGYGLASVDLNTNSILYTKPNGARGIYLDDAASAFLIFGNVLNNAGIYSIQLGGGRDNTIENNAIQTNLGYAILVDNRSTDYNWEANRNRLQEVPYLSTVWKAKYPKLAIPMQNDTWPEGNSIQKNIIVNTNANRPTAHYFMPEESNTIKQNILWNTTGAVRINYNILDTAKSRYVATWAIWLSEGIESDSLNVDPCMTIETNQVSFCSDSPVSNIGFEPIPTDIGLLN